VCKLSGVSRCEGLDHVTVTVSLTLSAVSAAVQVAIKKAYVAADVSFGSGVVEVDTQNPQWETVKVGGHHGSTGPAFGVRWFGTEHVPPRCQLTLSGKTCVEHSRVHIRITDVCVWKAPKS
jgi:hypothetical protein